MSAESFIVTISDGTTDHTYSLESRTGYKTRWANTLNSASHKRYLDIDHQMKPAGSLGTDTHLLTFREETINSTTGALGVMTLGMVFKVPRASDFTAAVISDGVSSLASLMSKNFMATFPTGATPSGDYNVTSPFNPARV